MSQKAPDSAEKRRPTHAHQMREAVADKASQRSTADTAPERAAANPHGTLPALGGSGLDVVGGVGAHLAHAERNARDPAAELARVKALPPGDPELQKYVKPEALQAQVAEGAGASSGAQQAAAGLSPQTVPAPPATVGPSVPAVQAASAGAQVPAPDPQLAAPSPTQSAATQALTQASAALPAPAAPTQDATPPAPIAAVAPASLPAPEARTVPVPVVADMRPAGGSTLPGAQVAGPEAARSATPAQPSTGDAAALAHGVAGPKPVPESAIASPAAALVAPPASQDAAVPTHTEAAVSATHEPVVAGDQPAAAPSREVVAAPAAVAAVPKSETREVSTGGGATPATAPTSAVLAPAAVPVAAPSSARTSPNSPAPQAEAAAPARAPTVAQGTVAAAAAAEVTAAPIASGATRAPHPPTGGPAPEAQAEAEMATTGAPSAVAAPQATEQAGVVATPAPVAETPAPTALQDAAVATPTAAAQTVFAEPEAARAAFGQPALVDAPYGARPNPTTAQTRADPAANIKAVLGEGAPLQASVRDPAERALQTSLSGVRLHEGSDAAALAKQHGARAFAQGQDIVIGAAGQLAADEQAAILAEELVHVVQMGGRSAADRGATGASTGNDPEEREARAAAESVLAGDEVTGLGKKRAGKAIYRNDGPTATSAPMPPERVQLSIAGRVIQVRLPKLAAGTLEHRATLPDPGIPGLKLEHQALLRFSPTTGQLVGGTAWAALSLGKTLRAQSVSLAIDADGSIATTLPQVALTVGKLLDVTAQAHVGPAGVSSTTPVDAADLRDAALQKWLRGGNFEVNVDSAGAVTGSGTLGIRVDPFGDGALAAQLSGDQLTGSATVTSKAEIPLGIGASTKGGTVSGTWDGKSLGLNGGLALDIPAIGRGTGTANVQWSSDGEKIAGSATYSAKAASSVGKLAIRSAEVTGSIADSTLAKVSGSGAGTFDGTFAGTYHGELDLTGTQSAFAVQGPLAAAITQGEATVAKGDLTVAVEGDVVKSIAGQTDFRLGAEMVGKATLETGTSQKAIQATATAALVTPRPLGDVTVSKGAMNLKVRGAQVEIVGGTVDFAYRNVASGALNLHASPDARRLTGTGTAKTTAPQTWGDIAVKAAEFDVHLVDNVADTAQGRADIEWAGIAKGKIAFDALNDFNAIHATATATLTKPVTLTAPLQLMPDEKSVFNVAFESSRFKELSGHFAWQHEGFRGDVGTTAPIADLQELSGRGKADVGAPFAIAETDGQKLMAQPSSKLNATIEGGRFTGVGGTLNWQYANWLAGKATIPKATTDIRQIDGTLRAQVIAAQPLPGHPDVVLQPGAKGALQVAIADSVPVRYSGKLNYIFQNFLKGDVTVAGDMLAFNDLQGRSNADVIAEKVLPNATLIPGGKLAVEFVNSDFNAFSGSAAFRYQDWLQGTANVGAKDGASMQTGIAGRAHATLTKALPGAGDFVWQKGGTVRTRLAPGVVLSHFDAGSVLNWQSGKTLGGTVTLRNDASFNGPTETSAASVLKRRDLSGDPKIALLPSGGLNVDLAAGAIARLSGKVAAELDGWAKGALRVDKGTTESVTGEFTGAILADKPVGGTETTLVAGGHVTVPVRSNSADGISGQIPFRYGAGTGWLRGTLDGRSKGAGINSLSGTVLAARITSTMNLAGGFTLKPGGKLTMPMTASHIDRLGGEANWSANEQGVNSWIGGIVTLSDKSTPTLVDGAWHGNIDKPLAISPTLKLMPGGGLSGHIAQNAVTRISGPVAWQIEDWLQGTVDVTDAEPHRVAGLGPAQITRQLDILPGKLAVTPGGKFSATLRAGQLVNIAGDVPFLWQDWLAGSVHAEAGTRTSLVGPVQARVVGTGTTLGPVQLLPGGALTAQLTAAGVDQVEGQANVAYGTANDGSAWHLEATAAVKAASASTFRGELTGRLASDRKLPPSLVLRRGGQLSAQVKGASLSQLSGDVNYAFAPGGSPVVEGALHIAAASSPQELSGSIDGHVTAPITGPGIKILPGGSVSGELNRNVSVKLGGALEAEIGGIAKGRIDVDGQFDPTQAQVSGRVDAALQKDQTVGPLTVRQGSGIGGKLDNNVLTEVWGKLSANVGDFHGVLDVPEGSKATLDALSGTAEMRLEKDKAVGGSGLVVQAGSGVQTTITRNALGTLHGTLGWQYADWLKGQVTADVSPDFATVNGQATAQLAAAKAVGPLTLQPGGNLTAKLQDGKPGTLAGDVAWTWGDGDWLKGAATLQPSENLQNLRGDAKATLAQPKRLGDHVVLQPGGALTTRIDASQVGAMTGDVVVGYDDWLQGKLHVDASRLDAVSGRLDASLLRHQTFGDLTLRRGGHLQVDLAESTVKSLAGEAGWQWQDALEGSVTLAPSTPESVRGSGTASLRQPVAIPGGVELQRGGQLQAKLSANQVEEVTGDVSWRYAEWLKGNVALSATGKALAPTGQAQATVAQTKTFGNWTLVQGGALEANLTDGKLDTLGGHAAVRWQDWLDGALEMETGKPDQWRGHAQATLRVAHDMGNGLTLDRGGAIGIDVDAQKPLDDAPVSGHLTFTAQGWLRGDVDVTQSPLARPTGEATATLAQDKRLGDVLLRRGGDLTATLQDGQVKTLTGTLNWQLGTWLGGTLQAETPMALDKLEGRASVALLTEKQLGAGVKLLPGGKLDAHVAGGQVAQLAGTARYGLDGWLEGSLELAPTPSLATVSGTGSARVLTEKAVGASGLKVLPGSQLQVDVTANAVSHVQGGVRWQLADWLAGTTEVDAAKLETLEGKAQARLLAEKPLAGGAKLLPGGAAEVTFANGAPATWGGTIGWQYADWLTGRVTLAGQSTLSDLNGEADVRVLADKPLVGGFALLRGGSLKTTLAQGKPGGLTGDLRTRYADWLEGNLHTQDATLAALDGQLTAAVTTNHALAGGLTLQRGGGLKVDIAAGKLGDVDGQVAFAYTGGALSADGTLTVQKSPLTGLAGTAQARLTAATKPVQETSLLPGGALNLEVRDGKPESLSGRVAWQHSAWLGGALELKPKTPVAGPFVGEASARLLTDKGLGSRVLLKAGGHVRVQLDSGRAVAQSPASGVIAAQLDEWLGGSVTLQAGSTLTQLDGSAELGLLADKPLSDVVTLKKGGTVHANVKQNAVSDLSGLALIEYDRWLAGSVHVEPTADVKSVTGDATLQLQADRPFGALTLQKGGDVRARIVGGKLANLGGMVDWRYENWLRGNLTVNGSSTLANVSGTGAAVVTAERPAGANVTIQPGGQLSATIAANKIEKVRGNAAFQWQKWVDGRVRLDRDVAPESLAGEADARTLTDKALGGQVTLLRASRAQASLENGELTKWQGTVGFRYSDFVEGRLNLEGGTSLDQLKGQATVSVVREKPLGGRVDLLKGGTLDGRFDANGLQNAHGAAAIRYDKWLTGNVTAQGEGGLEHLAGHGSLQVDTEKKFGLLTLKKGSVLDAEFADNAVESYRGNVDVTLDAWLAGNLRFEATDLADVSGEASLNVTQPHALAGPLSVLPGSRLRAQVAKSQLASFGGAAKLDFRGLGTGDLAVRDGSTAQHLSGSGKLELTTPKPLGPLVTLTRGSLGAEVEDNALTSVWGRADGEVKGFGTGWVALEHGAKLDAFDGQAGIKLTTPRKIGRFAELSGGEILANFKANALESFGGKADITVYGWGKGSVQIDAGSTLDSLKGAASLKLTEPRSLAGGKVKITGGEVSALVDGQVLTQVAGNVDLELPEIARGRVGGEIDLAKNTFSGQGTVQQIKPWSAGPAKVTDATLSASIVDGRLASASGSAQIDAGQMGRGTFQVNYEDAGNGPLLYGAGELQFQPHERVQGKLGVALSRDQKLTGRGEVDVKITDTIRGKAMAALDADGHVKLAGGVTIPGPFEVFKPQPWQKDFKFLDASFLVYTPPTVKVKVGAGMGLAVGVKPLTLRNLSLGGEVDLMDPTFAAMSVAGQMSSAAYADLKVYVEGSVQVSAAVVAVEAGLHAALNLHLEAAIDANPTLTVNRRGLGFDMPVDARLSAALNLLLTFFAKVKVGLDLGIVSVMETVWQYNKSPDPLKLGDFAIGAKGRVTADAGGMRASMTPDYKPPELTVESLKKALRL